MKNSILIAFMLLSLPSFAQTGAYLQPEIGYGIGNAHFNEPENEPSTKLIGIYAVQAGIGYQFDHVVLASGLGYMRSGFAVDIYETDFAGNIIGYGLQKIHYNHLAIPLSIGYKLHLGKQCSFTPVLGIQLTYNYSGVEVLAINGHKDMHKLSDEDFNDSYKPLSVFGLVRVNVEFALTRRVGIVVSPCFNYMLTNLYKVPPILNATDYQQHNYTLMLNAGVKWNLSAPVAKKNVVK